MLDISIRQLYRQNASLCAAEGQLASLVQHLQRRARTLEGEASSLQQVVARLKADLEASNSRANLAEQARLDVAEKLRDSLRSQEQQQRLMQQVHDMNLLRESNTTLRLVCSAIPAEQGSLLVVMTTVE